MPKFVGLRYRVRNGDFTGEFCKGHKQVECLSCGSQLTLADNCTENILLKSNGRERNEEY